MEAKDRIIVALDVSDPMELDRAAASLAGEVGMFKLGLETMHAIGGPQAVHIVRRHGLGVFYDSKLHDIPKTVARASAAIARIGPAFFNVHACGGRPMMHAAAEQAGDSKLLAVTVLTSHNARNCELIFGDTPEMKAVAFAMDAMDSGCDGVICSPLEIGAVREAVGRRALIVTPGVRPAWAGHDDQKRVMTPGEAVRAGADYIVIGRPVVQAERYGLRPHEAARRIAAELGEALGC